MATLIPAIGDPRPVFPCQGDSFTLAELQAIVGGYLEALRVSDELVMFLNEDGKRLQLPVNRIATMGMLATLQPGDVIVGDVIICTLKEAGEEDEDEEEEP